MREIISLAEEVHFYLWHCSMVLDVFFFYNSYPTATYWKRTVPSCHVLSKQKQLEEYEIYSWIVVLKKVRIKSARLS